MSRRDSFAWLVISLIAVHACMASTRVAGSLWLLQRGYGEQVLGVMLSLFALAPIVLSMWAGRLADRHGLHRPLGVGVIMGLAGALAVLLWPSVATVAFSGLMSGGALSLCAVGIQREAGLLAEEPEDLRRIFSWVAIGPAISNMLAPVTTGLLIDHAGFTVAFAWTLLLPLLAWWAAGRIPRIEPALKSHAQEAGGAWQLLRHKPLQMLLLVNLIMSATWDAHTFVVPVLGHARELSASSIGFILGSFAAAATFVRLLIVRWSGHLEEGTVLRAAMALAALVLALYSWLPGTVGLMAGSAVLGLALGSVQPMILSQLHQVTPFDRHGQALGLRMAVTNMITLVMPAGFGVLAAATLPAAPMWLMAALLLAGQWPASKVGRGGA